MFQLNRTLSFFFQLKFVNKDKYSCSDDDASASTSSTSSNSIPPRLSPPSRLSSPSPNYRKDDDIVDVDGDDDVDVADGDGDYGNDVAYDSEEERRGFNSLMANYELVRKEI